MNSLLNYTHETICFQGGMRPGMPYYRLHDYLRQLQQADEDQSQGDQYYSYY